MIQLPQSQIDRLTTDRDDIEDILPLSPMQAGMLFHTLLEPDSGMYITQMVFKIDGKFNIDILRSAWNKLFDQIDLFRASFHWKGLTHPVQLIRKKVEMPWRQLDWTDYDQQDFFCLARRRARTGIFMEFRTTNAANDGAHRREDKLFCMDPPSYFIRWVEYSFNS